MHTSSGCGCGHHCNVEGLATSLVLLLAPSAGRLSAASIRRSSLHLTSCCHLRPPSALCLQVGTCTKECVVLYLSADDYPNSQMMGMCNNDNELNSKLEGLSEQFEYGASIGEVLQQVCHASLSMSRPKPLPIGFPHHVRRLSLACFLLPASRRSCRNWHASLALGRPKHLPEWSLPRHAPCVHVPLLHAQRMLLSQCLSTASPNGPASWARQCLQLVLLQ